MNEPFSQTDHSRVPREGESVLEGTQHGINQLLFFFLDSNPLLLVALFHCFAKLSIYPMELCPIGHKGTRFPLPHPRSNALFKKNLKKKKTHLPSQSCILSVSSGLGPRYTFRAIITLVCGHPSVRPITHHDAETGLDAMPRSIRA